MSEIRVENATAAGLVRALRMAPSGCKRVWVRGPIGDAGAEILASSAKMADAVVLEIYASKMGPAGVAMLAASPRLRHLRALSLFGADIGEVGAEALAASPVLRGITKLACDIGGELELLLDSEPFASLHVLTLGQSRAAALALRSWRRRPPSLGRLTISRTEELSTARIGADGARAIAESPHLRALQALYIHGENAIGEEGGAALAHAPFAATLEELCIEGFSLGSSYPKPHELVGSSTLARVAGNPAFARLRHLALNEGGIGPSGVAALAASTTLTGLRVLELRRNRQIDAASIAQLASSPIAEGLEVLDLACTGGGADGAWALVKSPHLTRLEKLTYTSNEIRCDQPATYDQGVEITPEFAGDPAALAMLDRWGGRVAVH